MRDEGMSALFTTTEGKEAMSEGQRFSAVAWKVPMCACGHTKASHSVDGCFACAGPPCDIERREAIARALYAAFGKRESGRAWDDLCGEVLRDHFYQQADLVLDCVDAYGDA